MRRVRSVWGILAALALVSVTTRARAGGNEYNGAGTRAAGRGGAFAARADDPMALQLNPALMSDLTGVQLLLNLNLGFSQSCQARPGSYGDPGRTQGEPTRFAPGWETNPFPEVCNETPFSPGASLAATFQLAEGLTLGVGVLTPYASGMKQFGAEDGTVAGGTLPAPNRYNLVSQNLFQIFPSVGVGYRVAPWLALGATFQWGITNIRYTNYGSSSSGGEDPALDIRTALAVNDYFTPAVIASAAVRPMRGLDVMVGFRYLDDVKAGGTLTLRAHDFDDPAERNATTVVDGVRLLAQQSSAITFGVRYGHARSGAAGEGVSEAVHDRMSTELFDIELDAVYELHNRVKEYVVSIPRDATADVPASGVSSAPLPDQIRLPHNWQNQLSLRLGGDWNVLPGRLALRLGGAYETSGVDPRYVQLDFINGERISVHGGATVRFGQLDLSLAYLHIFQTDIVSTATDTVGLPQSALSDAGAIVNQGTFTGSFDVLSLGASYRF
jgi:long-subunit fatty acid transport protein